ncbi:MAG TPA: hypothetical protein VKS82_14040 [Streptosporangiaceae bacterium]|nr:hypothetical protein [Streptosporangiaceae bacterium]
MFPAPLMTTIAELGTFLAREQAAAGPPPQAANGRTSAAVAVNGTAASERGEPG